MNLQLTLALRYLQGRKLRTVLTTLAIVFGVLLIFGMNSLLPVFTQAFQANAMAAANQFDAIITSKTGEAFPESVQDTVTAVEGVRVASGALERVVTLPPDYFDQDPGAPDRASAVNVVGVRPEEARSVSAYVIVEGRFLEEGEAQAAVISQSLAEIAGVQAGDVLRLPTSTGSVDLSVAGILPQRLMPGNEEVLVTLATAQALFDSPGQINTIRANFDSLNEATRREIEQNIIASLGSSFALGVLQPGAEILSNMQVAAMIFNLLGGLGLLMGGFIIFNTFRTIVAERRRDIGMLRSVGAERSTIAGIILAEGLIQGGIGAAVGLALGYLFAQLMLVLVTPLLRQFMNLQFPGVTISPVLVLVSILAGVGITLLAGLIPARAASRVSPLEALRPSVGSLSIRRMAGLAFWAGTAMIVVAVLTLFSANAGLVGLGSVLFVAGLILVAPALVNPIARMFGALTALIFARDGTASLAESNLVRQPGRAAITASTTMISLAILVMAASIISSIALSFSNMLRESLSSDYLLTPPSVTTWGVNVGAAPALAEELRDVEGVEVVSTMRFAGTQINDVAVGLLGIEPRAYQETSGLTFIEGDPEAAFREMEAGRGMIINGLLGTSAGLELGEVVTVLTAAGEANYTVVGIASDFLNAKTTTAYISQANIAADFGRTEDVFFQINLEEGADWDAVEAAFKRALIPYPQFKLVSGQEYLEQNMGLFQSMFAGMIFLALFLSIPSLMAMVNTLAIGVIERRREIGMLRAVGATREQVGRVILAEAIILAAIGTAFGLLAGLFLGYSAVGAFGAAGFPIDYVFPASGVVVAIAAGLLFGALAAVIPARQATNLPIVAALRYE